MLHFVQNADGKIEQLSVHFHDIHSSISSHVHFFHKKFVILCKCKLQLIRRNRHKRVLLFVSKHASMSVEDYCFLSTCVSEVFAKWEWRSLKQVYSQSTAEEAARIKLRHCIATTLITIPMHTVQCVFKYGIPYSSSFHTRVSEVQYFCSHHTKIHSRYDQLKNR